MYICGVITTNMSFAGIDPLIMFCCTQLHTLVYLFESIFFFIWAAFVQFNLLYSPFSKFKLAMRCHPY